MIASQTKTTPMDLVLFITLESGTDLIVSFAVLDSFDHDDFESLTILRTPKFEVLLYEWERGASLTYEGGDDDEDDGEPDLLREVVYMPEEKTVMLRTDRHRYTLDLRKVESDELSGMCRVFRLMNFDSSIDLKGI